MKKLKVLLLFDAPYAKSRDYDWAEELQGVDWAAERFVKEALIENGHDLRMLGL